MDVRLVVYKGDEYRTTIRLRRADSVVGRAADCAIRVPSGDVSRRHCRLCVRKGVVAVEDLGSVNGTFLNAELVTGQAFVRPGDRLEVGPVTFEVGYALTPAARALLDRGDPEAVMGAAGAAGAAASAPLTQAAAEALARGEESQLIRLDEVAEEDEIIVVRRSESAPKPKPKPGAARVPEDDAPTPVQLPMLPEVEEAALQSQRLSLPQGDDLRLLLESLDDPDARPKKKRRP